jgi:hypothetical protein
MSVIKEICHYGFGESISHGNQMKNRTDKPISRHGQASAKTLYKFRLKAYVYDVTRWDEHL